MGCSTIFQNAEEARYQRDLEKTLESKRVLIQDLAMGIQDRDGEIEELKAKLDSLMRHENG